MNKKYMNRVELSCHTNYSKNRAVTSVKDILSFANEQGMSAVAFTDSGNVRAFPAIQNLSKMYDGVKPIYGLDAYVVNDIDILGENLDEIRECSIDTDVVVVDLETTGFFPASNEIIEIGALKIKNGSVTDRFHCLVKPTQHISGEIHHLTGIDDFMLRNEDTIETVFPKFLEFIGDSILVDDSGTFYSDFIKKNARHLGIEKKFRSLDARIISKILFTDLENYKFDTVVKACGIKEGNSYIPMGDANKTADVYCELLKMLKAKGVKTIGDLQQMAADSENLIKRNSGYYVTVLAKNMAGVQAIYKLVSNSNEKYFDWDRYTMPKIKFSDLLQNRENLLIGSGNTNGMLGELIACGSLQTDVENIAAYFDYLEVQPADELTWMIEDELYDIKSQEDIIAYINTIITLGEKLGKPVAAVSNVRFMRPENAVSYAVVREYEGVENPDMTDNLYFRTTQEMIESFVYLGEEKAYEVVVENTNKIAEMTECIEPLKHERLDYSRDGDYERLEVLCHEGLKRVFGENANVETIPAKVKERLYSELQGIKDNDFAYIYLYYYDLIAVNNLTQAQYSIRGTAASSLVCYLLGISHTNPIDEKLPLYNEFFAGFEGNKLPDIDLNVDGTIREKVLESVKSLPGIKNAYKAASQCFNSDGHVNYMIDSYETWVKPLTEAEKCIAKRNLEHTFCKTHVYTGGVLIVPEGIDETIYTPLDIDDESYEKVFQFDYHDLDHIFEKLDILEQGRCTLNNRLYEATGYYPSDEDIRSEEILSLIIDSGALGIKSGSNYGVKNGLLGIPGFGSLQMYNLIDTLKPSTFEELVKLEGIAHGSDTWFGNGEVLWLDGKATLKDMIGSREDVYEMLLSHGIEKKKAFTMAENIRKGKMGRHKVPENYVSIMDEAGIPAWYIWSCEKVSYLFPRAHAAEYVQMELRSLYYKLHYPEKYYQIYFELYGTAKLKEYMAMGDKGFEEMNYYLMSDERASSRDEQLLKVWNEMRLRGSNSAEIESLSETYDNNVHTTQELADAWQNITGRRCPPPLSEA